MNKVIQIFVLLAFFIWNLIFPQLQQFATITISAVSAHFLFRRFLDMLISCTGSSSGYMQSHFEARITDLQNQQMLCPMQRWVIISPSM